MTLQREQTHSLRPVSVAKSLPRTASKRKAPVRAMPNREHEAYLIKELQHLLRSRIEARIRTQGIWLSFPHSMVLMTLSEQPGLSGVQLARCCGVTAQTMNGLLVSLEAKGFILRGQDPTNARVLKSELTAKGRLQLQQGMQEAGSVFEQMLSALSQRERTEFRRLLHRCIDALNQPPAAALRKPRRATQG
jgi:DNA-binding MarR family transcriptional regulator